MRKTKINTSACPFNQCALNIHGVVGYKMLFGSLMYLAILSPNVNGYMCSELYYDDIAW